MQGANDEENKAAKYQEERISPCGEEGVSGENKDTTEPVKAANQDSHVEVQDHYYVDVPTKKGTWRNIGHQKQPKDRKGHSKGKHSKRSKERAGKGQDSSGSINWFTMALVFVIIGYESSVVGIVKSAGNLTSGCMFVLAFLGYTVVSLMLSLQHIGELRQTRNRTIVCCILCFITGIFLIVGMSIWGSGMGAYVGTLNSTGAALALLGGIFLILAMVGGGKTEPS